MKLKSFQVKDFRSINDSGKIETDHRTVLVGRNESGKSSLLRVLAGLKCAQLPTFTLARDFPRDRPRRDFNEASVVLDSRWEFDEGDRSDLGARWSRAGKVTDATVRRTYKAERAVEFHGLLPLDSQATGPRQAAADLIGVAQEGSVEPVSPMLEAVTGLHQAVSATIEEGAAPTWAAKVAEAVAKLRAANGAGKPLPESMQARVSEIEQGAAAIGKDAEAQKAAIDLVLQQAMPTFVYLDEWDEVPGHHDIPAFLERRRRGAPSSEDKLFEKLLKVAELDAEELNRLLTQNHEERKLLTSRAGRVMTKTLRALWKDRKITVDFSLDEKHFDVVVSDADTEALVPLDERSRGFRWYFSFFVTFAADTQGGDKEHAILLLDEPGLFLHATAQDALLRFFDQLPNQIIYSTHSPFMIDPVRIASVRTVNLAEGRGTTVSGVPTGDANTLFPIQAALGYDLTQTMFVGSKTVVVEGVTDYWFLSAVSEYLSDHGRQGVDRDIVITPAGGAPKIPYMLALLTAQNLRVVALFDSEPQAEATALEAIKQKLVRPDGIVRVGDAFAQAPAGGCDVEDVLGDDAFLALVEQAYAKELAGRNAAWNKSIPRVAIRAGEGLGALGIPFHKTRPARLFLDAMAKEPERVLSSAAQDRFERLFKAVNEAVRKLATSDRTPFR